MSDLLNHKFEELKAILKGYGKLAVAFSGGVDSTFLLKAAIECLGTENVLAITASSHSFPERELKDSNSFCKQNNISHEVVYTNEFEIEGFRANPVNRCYLCKKELFSRIIATANAHGISYVAEGSNIDDNGDYRPGMVAIRELQVKSPLREAGLSKEDIRMLSKSYGLPTWSKPSFACLATRFVYGEEITEQKLDMVDKAEQLLFDKGFKQFRVRIHGNMARIELLPQDISIMLQDNLREEIYSNLKEYGFDYVTLDLCGYRTGSMNETLSDDVVKNLGMGL